MLIGMVISRAVELTEEGASESLTEQVRWFFRQWKTRFHIALGLLIVVALLDIIRVIEAGDRVFWSLYVLWGMLVFGLYLRKFWAWAIILVVSGTQAALVVFKLGMHQYHPGEPLTWLYIALGYWLGAFLVLIISRPEFTE